MKNRSAILAGTALGLMMGSSPLAALPWVNDPLSTPSSEVNFVKVRTGGAKVILVQSDEERPQESEEETEPAAEQPDGENTPAQDAPAPAEEPPEGSDAGSPDEEAPTDGRPGSDAQPPSDEAAPDPQSDSPPTDAPEETEPAEEESAPAEDPAASDSQGDDPRDPVEPTPETQAEPPVPEATGDEPAQADEPAAPLGRDGEAQNGEGSAPETEAEPTLPVAPEEEPAQADEPAVPQGRDGGASDDDGGAPETAAQPQPSEASEDDPAQAGEPAASEGQASEQQNGDGSPLQTGEDPDEIDAGDQQESDPQADPSTSAEEVLPEDAAPILDSAKEDPREETSDDEAQAPGSQPNMPPPDSDEAAQTDLEVNQEQIRAIVSEEGRRVERSREARRPVRDGAEVVREIDNRIIIQFNDRYHIERPREERFFVDAEEVYYEELPRGRQREVVLRPNGTRIVTIRNRYGDVLHRVKVLPDDRQIIMAYTDDRYYQTADAWRDPGAELPPLRLPIPAHEYILDAERAVEPDDYYVFLDQPPVEEVERTYSLTEVTRSARIRDKVRRIDLDVINFEFGSANIGEGEIAKLEGVAEAMQRLIEENPGETFLLEGHTDAVGSDLANLALSDQRADSVAVALTNVFDIPPENLVTQGYGEQYLKIQSEEPERENRRVAIRRITPLIAPVARAN